MSDPYLFSFSSQGPWQFHYVDGTRLVYVYRNTSARYAQEAMPIEPTVDPSREAAVDAAKSWVRSRSNWGTRDWHATGPVKHRHKPTDRLVDTVQFKQLSALADAANLLTEMVDGMSLEQAKLRITVMAGELDSTTYRNQIITAMSEVARAHGAKGAPPVAPEETTSDGIVSLF